jgi:hypothetical protein
VLKTVNNFVACRPFEPLQVQQVNKHELAVITKKAQVVGLNVCYDSRGDGGNKPYFYLSPGDVVYVKSSCVNSPWAKEKLTFQNGNIKGEFILVPFSEIVMVGIEDISKKAYKEEAASEEIGAN